MTKDEFYKKFGYLPRRVDYDDWFFSNCADKGVTWEQYKSIAEQEQAYLRGKEEAQSVDEGALGWKVEIKPIVVEGEPDAHIVKFNIGHQYFTLSDYQDTKEEAQFMADMLSKALYKLSNKVNGEG